MAKNTPAIFYRSEYLFYIHYSTGDCACAGCWSSPQRQAGTGKNKSTLLRSSTACAQDIPIREPGLSRPACLLQRRKAPSKTGNTIKPPVLESSKKKQRPGARLALFPAGPAPLLANIYTAGRQGYKNKAYTLPAGLCWLVLACAGLCFCLLAIACPCLLLSFCVYSVQE